MEHRCGQRLLVNLPATLRISTGDSLRVTIRNISCGGAFIKVPVGCEVKRGLIELEVCLPWQSRQVYRWKALLVHRDVHGVGLMFNELQLGELLPFLAAEKLLRRLGIPAEAGNGAVSAR